MKKIILIVTLAHFLLFFQGFIFSKKNLKVENIKQKSELVIKIGSKPKKQSFSNLNTKNNNETVPIKKTVKKNNKSKIKNNKKLEKIIKKEKKVESENKKENENHIKEKNTQNNSPELPSNISRIQGDGLLANSSKGIEYEIIREFSPKYPKKAQFLRLKKTITIKVRFLVGNSGLIKKIEFLSKKNNLGFEEEIKIALKKWKFKPIFYKNEPIKVYFQKDFTFKPQ